jgi:hypothetical protein
MKPKNHSGYYPSDAIQALAISLGATTVRGYYLPRNDNGTRVLLFRYYFAEDGTEVGYSMPFGFDTGEEIPFHHFPKGRVWAARYLSDKNLDLPRELN